MPVYLGAGGVGGLITTLLGGIAPGMSMAGLYAEGNSLGKGPAVLIMPPELFVAVGHLSRLEKLASYQQLELSMFRAAATYVLDLLREQVTGQLSEFVRGVMQDVIAEAPGSAGPGHPQRAAAGYLARRQRIRALLREG